MRKELFLFFAVVFAACQPASPYVFDVAKILTLDARKLPESLGVPFKATLPDANEIAEKGNLAQGVYQYVKGQYSMSIFYYDKTGAIKNIEVTKIIPSAEKASVNVGKEKEELPLEFNLNGINKADYQIDSIGAFDQPGAPLLIHAGIKLANRKDSTDASDGFMHPAAKP